MSIFWLYASNELTHQKIKIILVTINYIGILAYI